MPAQYVNPNPVVVDLGANRDAYLTNGTPSSQSLNISLEDIRRVADSIPPTQRGSHLRMNVWNQPNYWNMQTGQDIGSVASNIVTVTIPWPEIAQMQAAVGQAHQQTGSGMQSMLGGLGAQTASGGQQAAFSYDVMVQQQQMNGIWNTLYNSMVYTTGSITSSNYFNWVMSVEETPEQRVAREERYAKEMAKKKAAECRAEQLLFTILRPEQVRQYKDHGYFETEVDDRLYRIKKGRAQNVELIESGKPVMRLCAHPSEWTPDADAVLSQFLMLRSNEQEFLRIANKTRLHG